MPKSTPLPVFSVHTLWRHVRGPFRVIHCEGHVWDRYDCNRAGCLLCGAEHVCHGNLVDSSCTLAHLDDGSVCCEVTGFCVPIVRYAKSEYVDGAGPAEYSKGVSGGGEGYRHSVASDLHEDVLCIVEWFLGGHQAETSKRDEVNRALVKLQSTTVKLLKQHKTDAPLSLPTLPDMIAKALHAHKPRKCAVASRALCLECSERITKCLTDLGLVGAQGKRVNLVVGALYLMKSGLVIKNIQWLPRVPALCHCLPHESSLERGFGLSNKLICSSENELKLALRQREKML